MTTFPTGHLRADDAEAERIARRHVRDLIGAVPTSDEEQDLRDWSGPVTTQVGNSCCWDASLGAIESRSRMLGWPCPKLSVKASWVWAQLRDQHRRRVPFAARRAWDQGSRLDMGFLALHEHGLVSEERCSFEPGDLVPKPDGLADIRIPLDVDLAGADALFTGDYGVDPADAPSALRAAMRAGYFPIIAIDVDERFMALYGAGATYDGVVDAREIVGGHAMRVVGSRPARGSAPSALLLQNSWGEGWGDDGYVWLTDRAAMRGRDAVVVTGGITRVT